MLRLTVDSKGTGKPAFLTGHVTINALNPEHRKCCNVNSRKQSSMMVQSGNVSLKLTEQISLASGHPGVSMRTDQKCERTEKCRRNVLHDSIYYCWKTDSGAEHLGNGPPRDVGKRRGSPWSLEASSSDKVEMGRRGEAEKDKTTNEF